MVFYGVRNFSVTIDVTGYKVYVNLAIGSKADFPVVQVNLAATVALLG